MNGRLPTRTVETCLRAAVAAPSVHNTQPWRFRLGERAIEVLIDPGRALDVIDPQRRAMFISVGAAVFNLRLALAAEGWTSRLEPPPPGADAVMRVVLGPRRTPSGGILLLASAIVRRRTNRAPYRNVVVPEATMDDLCAAAAADGIRLIAPGPVRRGAILAITMAADARQQADPAYRRELAAWTAATAFRRDGVAVRVFGPRATTAAVPLRDFGLGLPSIQRDAARFEDHPQLVVLHSRGDDRAAWLGTGQSLQRVLLTATVRGLAAQPLTQALEVAEFRRFLADPSGVWSPQMILRIGYGAAVPIGPRRPLRTFVMTAPGY